MCGIGGIVDLSGGPVPGLGAGLSAINRLQAHRGPDGEGVWRHPSGSVGLAHRRLAIIDLDTGAQPMADGAGNVVVYNGEIYNYLELRRELGPESFRTTSDTEVILHAYRRWGEGCVDRFRGMFAFALWDEARGRLFCARDRFGIKPFYWLVRDGRFCFASEVKALLPFLGPIETDPEAFKEWLAFQFCLAGRTLFKGVSELPPGHLLTVGNGSVGQRRYWEVYYDLDWRHTALWFEERLRELFEESVRLHLRSDVPVGAYLSGGLDSSAVAAQAVRVAGLPLPAFTGAFDKGPDYDESGYARLLADANGIDLHLAAIGGDDFVRHLPDVVYHLDFPTAGPGSFPQYMVSRLAAGHRKVVLGGQGGDEIFGGYTRYLIAYFEQCIKAAIDGTSRNGNFVVTYESIIPNLTALRKYKPLLQEFWREGLFEPMDRRYFRLINRTADAAGLVRRERLGDYQPFETFSALFNGGNVGRGSYFDQMTHFDFKTLLPALLQVEDRVSMACGLESRVPLLDHPLVELAATIPANVKFENGTMKHVFKRMAAPLLPREIVERKDKMGFTTPVNEWFRGEARDFVCDLLGSGAACGRDLVDNRAVLALLDREGRFGRAVWGFVCFELWQCRFHDRQQEYAGLSDLPETTSTQEAT